MLTSLRPWISSAPRRKSGALRCVRDTMKHPEAANRPVSVTLIVLVRLHY